MESINASRRYIVKSIAAVRFSSGQCTWLVHIHLRKRPSSALSKHKMTQSRLQTDAAGVSVSISLVQVRLAERGSLAEERQKLATERASMCENLSQVGAASQLGVTIVTHEHCGSGCS